MKTIEDFNFNNKKALIRVDFNVPLDGDFNVTDTTRIEAAKPTIIKVLEEGGSAILMSHLGRPKGKRSDDLSLKHIVAKVSEIIGVEVKFVDQSVGQVAEQAMENLKSGEGLLLENLRFYAEEEAGDESFSEALSKLGDIYVNDAFGTAHRAHASTTIVAKYFGDHKCFGYLLAKEIEAIEKVMENGEKPVTAILGGSKVSSKITIIENILDKVDHLIIGGGMTYTFIKAQGGKIGDSICEDDKQELAVRILKDAEAKGVKVHLPVDVLAANDFDNNADTQVVDVNEIPDGWQGLDAGPKTLENFKEVILGSKTILWNGPIGVFEMPSFANGAKAVGTYIDPATQESAVSIVGVGDTVAALQPVGYAGRVKYVSTGGADMLETLEPKTLPGIGATVK